MLQKYRFRIECSSKTLDLEWTPGDRLFVVHSRESQKIVKTKDLGEMQTLEENLLI